MMTTTTPNKEDIELTEEQKERIRRNRERALEIRRRKQKEREEAAAAAAAASLKASQGNSTSSSTSKNNVTNNNGNNASKSIIRSNEANISKQRGENTDEDGEQQIELEEFEIGASQYVTKQDAMKIYCLSLGTLAVCKFVEKDNPRQSKWSKMKLYHRSEIRRRARERFGGLDGLIEERNKREKKRFERDHQSAHDVFESRKKMKK